MLMFTKMLEIMRAQGYVVTLPGQAKFYQEYGISPDELDIQEKRALWVEEFPREIEWKLFEKCEPFVFSAEEPTDMTKNARKLEAQWVEGFDKNESIDAPFPVFSVEYLDGKPLDFFVLKDGTYRETVAIIVVEIKPKEYGYYALCRNNNDNSQMKVFKSNTEGQTIQRLLQRLKIEKMGIETVRISVKLGTGKSKRKHRIRRIVHVVPKRDQESYSGTRNVDWSHRWEVRGHWRKHDGLGKDRNGDYCVSGWTWVTHYEKGPEHLPLVKKVRIVDENKGDES